MSSKQKLELNWIGKHDLKNKISPEPRILIETPEYSYEKHNEETQQMSFADSDKTKPQFNNVLIHGDNLLALKSLELEYAGKIKCIYIDPPYNTGTAFEHYDDNLEHSAWLNLMKPRLELLRNLLRNDGVIFVQIDDNEFAYLKVLMDEVFGRNNYLNLVSVKTKNVAGASGGGEDKKLKKNIEYLLIYTKNYELFKWLSKAYSYTEIYDLICWYKENDISWKYTSVLYDEGVPNYLCSTVDGDGNEIKIYNRENAKFLSVSQIAKLEKISEKDVYYKYMDRIHTTAMPQSSIRPRVMEKLKNIKHSDVISIKYVPKTGKNKGIEHEQFYKGDKFRLLTWLKDVSDFKNGHWYKKDVQGTLWDGINLNNLTKEGNVEFSNGKKPEKLLERIIGMATKPKDLVLDSFLGSGTTAAVAQKMGRKWIGIELGDHAYTHCYKRLKAVVDGEQGGISKEVDWHGGGGFKFYELAPSLIEKSKFGNPIISKKYDMEMLAQAVAKHKGYYYEPDSEVEWKQSKNGDKNFLFVTTNYITPDYLEYIHSMLKNDEHLLITTKAYHKNCENQFPNITVQQIPQSLLGDCDFMVDSYSLNVNEEPSENQKQEEADENED